VKHNFLNAKRLSSIPIILVAIWGQIIVGLFWPPDGSLLKYILILLASELLVAIPLALIVLKLRKNKK
jgi:hypothetical protein